MTTGSTGGLAQASPPRISVIVPCFNQGAYLDEALDSVAAQTCQDFEILVVDDGSTDEATLHVLDALRRPATVVVRSGNHGLSAARNLGASRARGEFLCCLDADDRLAPGWLETAVRLLDEDPELAFVSHWLETFGDERWEWKPTRCDLAMLLDRNTVNGAAVVRRDVFRATGGFDETMRDGCEDWEFWIRVVARGHPGAIVPETLFHYRRHAGSMSREMHHGERFLQIYADIIGKHPENYARHVHDLVLRRERAIADTATSIQAAEADLRTWLEPAVAERRREVARAQARLDEALAVEDLRRRAADASARAAELERRVQALHASWSWRVTAPLRRLYEWAGLARR